MTLNAYVKSKKKLKLYNITNKITFNKKSISPIKLYLLMDFKGNVTSPEKIINEASKTIYKINSLSIFISLLSQNK